MKNKSHRKKYDKSTRRHTPITAFVVLVPFVIALAMFYYMFGPGLMNDLATRGDNRLVTPGWQTAASELTSAKPTYETKYSYYQLQLGQNLQWAAQHFSVTLASLQKMNPGNAAWGTTIRVTPVERPLTVFPASDITTAGVTVTKGTDGVIVVANRFTNAKAYMTMPQLMKVTQQYGAVVQLSSKSYEITKPLYVQDNIRMDITNATVDNLYLRSDPNYDITTLTFRDSEALFDHVNVTSYVTTTKGPDTNYNDGRSFLRAYGSARMDMLDTTSSFMGMTKDQATNPALQARLGFISQGGVYGVSWRISSGTFGQNDSTGWIERSTFKHNYIGAFTFGAQGMMWRNNLFTENHVYGLDPHDDSNNATIEYNRFVSNGKHGFIVSKRCDYNVIKDNISIDNKLHGFMLHDNSDYNVFENNVAIGNYDNFVMYQSSFNMVRNNKAYNPRGSQVRINQASIQNYIENNQFYGGSRGVYLYGSDNGTEIANNTFRNVNYQLVTDGASRVLFSANTSNNLGYKLKKSDRVVFGVNKINKQENVDMRPLLTVQQSKLNGQTLAEAAIVARTQ